MDLIYLDHNGTTPLLPEVKETMARYLDLPLGNPSSLHQRGREARKIVETGRDQVGKLIGCRPQNVVFTSGGTESNNLAIWGGTELGHRKQGHIITTRVEHKSVLKPIKMLKKRGWEVTLLPVDKWGRLDAQTVADALRPDTALVSVMAANNETGTIQPVEEIGEIASQHPALFHIDAVQALGRMEVDVRRWKVDLLTISSHKLGGPLGVGALYVRKKVKLAPLLAGGGQEEGRRSGTENTLAIAGFGTACEVVKNRSVEDWDNLEENRQYLRNQMEEAFPQLEWNTHPLHHLPNTISATFPHIESEVLIMGLDLENICVSGGSACAARGQKGSHVLQAQGRSLREAQQSLRFSLGYETTRVQLDRVVEVLAQLVPTPVSDRSK